MASAPPGVARTPNEAHRLHRGPLRRAASALGRLALRGDNYRCPCCKASYRRFRPGPGGRENAACPGCGSLERHRCLALFLDSLEPEFLAGSILHFAPEGSIRPLLQGESGSYVGADLDPAPGDTKVDIQRIAFPDESFDLVVCSHVLEHVPDDARALRELRRIVRTSGMVLLQHPVEFGLAATVEDPSETDPRVRLKRFGQEDHVRRYGPDLKVRIAEAGFGVRILNRHDLSSCERDVNRLAEPWEQFGSASEVYVCKPLGT